MAVQKIILVFKTHFDIGFTDLAENVIRDYAGPMLRQVIETCRATEDLGPLRYVWTMPAWPLWTITERCGPGLRPELERLIGNGQIVWHALPFTSHTDFCAPEEFMQGLQYARLLSERYGKPLPLSGKMTDVPGHGLMLPELLDQAGIRFLHLGCNEFATPPQVPPLFFWESPGGGRVLTMYSKGGYGTSLLPPEDWPFPVWMALMHTHDNCGPQSAELIAGLAAQARAACPEAEVVCGTMDDFYRELSRCGLSGVPVVTEDLADTWIHGVGSYPAEVSQVREGWLLARKLHRACFARLAAGGGEIPGLRALWDRYDEAVCLFGEHTWGADVKTWLGPDRVYEKAAFQAARGTERCRFMEKSWAEQRMRAETAGSLLKEIAGKLPPLPPEREKPAGALALGSRDGRVTAENHRYRVRFDAGSGIIEEIYDKRLETPLLQSRDGIGVFAYQYDRYGLEDITEFLRGYAYHFTTWGIQDYGRENYPDCPHLSFRPTFEGYEVQGSSILFRFVSGRSASDYGDCRRMTLALTLPPEGGELEVELTLEDKQATPYVESGSLILPLAQESTFRLGRPCAVVDPETQIRTCANHALLQVENEVSAVGRPAGLAVCTPDAPLLSVGGPGVYAYYKEFPRDRKPQLWFNLFNNMWGTNFPQWIEGTLHYRFILWGCAPGEEERAPARAAEALRGPEEPLPGLPEDLELVHTRAEGDTLYITLRHYGGDTAERIIRMPGARLAEADLLGRIRGPWKRDVLAFHPRPWGLTRIALRGGDCL